MIFFANKDTSRLFPADRLTLKDEFILIPCFVPAPFRGDTKKDEKENIRRAVALGDYLSRQGWGVYVPHTQPYGDDFVAEDRKRAIDTTSSFAAIIGYVGGVMMGILCDDGSMSEGVQKEVDIFKNSGGKDIIMKTWDEWEKEFSNAT